MDSETNYNTRQEAIDSNSQPESQRQNYTETPSSQNESKSNTSSSSSSNPDTNNNDHVPTKGTAGVMESNFGSDHTTTSTFEKSQGEKFGEKFDDTGDLIKGRFSVSEESTKPGGDAKASGSGASHDKGHKTDDHKERFGEKIKHKAEGMYTFLLGSSIKLVV